MLKPPAKQVEPLPHSDQASPLPEVLVSLAALLATIRRPSAVDVPIMLLTMVGSTMLGIAWLRRRFRPFLVPILLVCSVPALFAITAVTSLGNVLLPFLFAFGILGREMALGRAVSGMTSRPLYRGAAVSRTSEPW